MATVVVNPLNVANSPEVGGHFWVYMQYVQSLLRLGCDVYWLERFSPGPNPGQNALLLANFLRHMDRYGLHGKVLLYTEADAGGGSMQREFIGMPRSKAYEVLRRADLLLNFHYGIDPELLSEFQRTALVDIDPGLLQFWISTGQLSVPRHDLYFTTGETVGTARAQFPNCGLPWIRIRPLVCLELWPFAAEASAEAFTTVSSWWGGGGKGEFVTDGCEVFYENNKRVTFLDFLALPRRSRQPLELALSLGEGDTPEQSKEKRERNRFQKPSRQWPDRHPYIGDEEDRRRMEAHGWRIRLSKEVAATPESYQAYVQGSRGEFSCAKPSCMVFQNAWISDRTLCYLASGRPAVVQNTGPSSFLPHGLGMFRFSTLEEAAAALAAIDADYARHRRAAREIAEALFDGKRIGEQILHSALAAGNAYV